MKKVSVLGIDIGKNVCSLVGFDASGAVVLRRRVKRETLIDLATKLPRCIVAMEACCGAHWPQPGFTIARSEDPV
jgi:transposase